MITVAANPVKLGLTEHLAMIQTLVKIVQQVWLFLTLCHCTNEPKHMVSLYLSCVNSSSYLQRIW